MAPSFLHYTPIILTDNKQLNLSEHVRLPGLVAQTHYLKKT